MWVSYLFESLFYCFWSEARNVLTLLVVGIGHTIHFIVSTGPAYSAHCRELRSHSYLLIIIRYKYKMA